MLFLQKTADLALDMQNFYQKKCCNYAPPKRSLYAYQGDIGVGKIFTPKVCRASNT